MIWIETISALDELKTAIDAANRTDLPNCCTLSFNTHGSTIMSIGPRTFLRFCEDGNLASYGGNCGLGPSKMIDTVLLKKQNIDLPFIAKGNSGIPSFKEGKIVYSGKS